MTKSNDKSRNVILINDNQREPLHEIVFMALMAAEKSNFSSIVLSPLRLNESTGERERNYRDISLDFLRGVEKYVDRSEGVIKKIFIAVPNNEKLANHFKKWLEVSKPALERSLRHNLREVNLSGKGYVIVPDVKGYRKPLRESPIYRDLLLPWDLKRLKDIYAPISLGSLKDKAGFSSDSISVLNMPIKMPGTEVRVPIELSHFHEFLQTILDHEILINPDFNNFFAYLTIDQSPVSAGKTQRQGGIHIDGVQGSRYPIKLPPEHTYSANDTLGTIFYPQKFDLAHVDPNKDFVHDILWDQHDPRSAMITKDYDIYFWNSYSVHEAQVSRVPIQRRTFIRVEFSKKVYDSHGDTRSPLFDYDWQPVRRPIPSEIVVK